MADHADRRSRLGRPSRWLHAPLVGLTLIALAVPVLVVVKLTAGGPAGPGTGGVPAGPTSPAAHRTGTSSPARTSVRPSARPGPSGSSDAKPGPGNTGVPPGTRLTQVSGDQHYTRDGQVISGVDIHGYVRISARNVVLKNAIVRGGAPTCNAAVIYVEDGASATIQDVEVAPAHPNACLDGVWAADSTLRRMNIHGTVDGVKAFDHLTLVDSWIHDLGEFASDPNQGGGATHNDAVQTYEGNQHILLRHNTLSVATDDNAAYQVTQDGGKPATDLRIEENWLDGGGCTLNFSHYGGPTPMTGIYVIGNRFGRHSYYQCPILVSTRTILTQVTGNVWDDTGAPIPPPQRHD